MLRVLENLHSADAALNPLPITRSLIKHRLAVDEQFGALTIADSLQVKMKGQETMKPNLDHGLET